MTLYGTTLGDYLDTLHKDDATIRIDEYDRTIRVTFDDFGGFDDEWEEIERPYTDDEAVSDFIEWIATSARIVTDIWDTFYCIDGWTVTIHYTSEDI